MLEVRVLDSTAAVALAAADVVSDLLASDPAAVVALPTGATPVEFYRELVHRVHAGDIDCSRATWVQLDEWLGIPTGHPATCAAWLASHFYQPAGIRVDQLVTIDPMTADPQGTARDVAGRLADLGGLDLAVLGLGHNGHLGLNEPGEELVAGVHVATLAESSRWHSMLGELRGRPSHGLTLGVGDLLGATTGTLVLATGIDKAGVVHRLCTGGVSTWFPASLLVLTRTRLLLDRSAAADLPAWRVGAGQSARREEA